MKNCIYCNIPLRKSNVFIVYYKNNCRCPYQSFEYSQDQTFKRFDVDLSYNKETYIYWGDMQTSFIKPKFAEPKLGYIFQALPIPAITAENLFKTFRQSMKLRSFK